MLVSKLNIDRIDNRTPIESGDYNRVTQPGALKRVVSSPYFKAAVGIAGLVSGVVFFLLGIQNKRPVYMVSPAEVITKPKRGCASCLGLAWDGKPVDDIRIVRIALWNSGLKSIDSADFLASDPVRIEPSGKIRFLYAEQSGASREKLRVSLPVDAADETVSIGFPVGDALHQNDGVTIRVVYNGSASVEFTVGGRVKEVPGGFSRIVTDKLSTNNPVLLWAPLSGLLALPFALLLSLLERVQRFRWAIMLAVGALASMLIAFAILWFRPLRPPWIGF
jgi:hypothetical protein